jgi:hypothetical protein
MQRMETEQSVDRLKISLPENKQSQFSNAEWRLKQLVALAEVFKEPVTPECLAMYVESLADLSDDQIRLCVGRAIRELKWFPKPAELRELAGASQQQGQDAEARKAWDVLTKFVKKYVSNDVYGNFGPQHGWYPKSYPKLSDRILDTVRRTGGWEVYARMTGEDFPFVQKRFFEEYATWAAVEQIVPGKLLTEMPQLHLIAKPMDSLTISERTPMARSVDVPAFRPKAIPEPLTNAQRRDRREMLRQQATAMAAKFGGHAGSSGRCSERNGVNTEERK